MCFKWSKSKYKFCCTVFSGSGWLMAHYPRAINSDPFPRSVPQNSMNLPPDKARLLRQYDNEKKWELICDQVSITRFSPPPQPVRLMSLPLSPKLLNSAPAADRVA